MNNQEEKIGYQFTAVPTNLYQCCDINVRSMLSTLVQLSSYYADSNGWFFRSNDDLRAQAKLSENLVRATLSTLYNIGVVDIKTVGKGKSKTPNQFKLNFDKFLKWECCDIEDCYKHPDFEIETDNYKDKGWQPSYLKSMDIRTVTDSVEVPTFQPTPSQSEDNIDNIKNKDNIHSEGSKQIEVKTNQFEDYKKCRVNQQVQHYEILLKKHSVGVLKLSFSLGLALIFILILLIFPSVTVLMSVPFGMYCLTSLFSFSTVPFCHEQ